MAIVLVVDDKDLLRDSVAQTLVRAGLEVAMADSMTAALASIAGKRPDAVITDLKMPGGSGLDLLTAIKQAHDDLPVVVMTAFGTIETAVKALKDGAFDYITKPFEGDELVITVKRAVEHGRILRENALLRSGGQPANTETPIGAGLARIVGDSAAMRRVKQQVLAVAESHGTVLICGESGTGKEVVARAVHELSPRKTGPFLGVNCAALSESLLESELFGHERGAFTGAERLRKGRFELAEMGTLLLDEISEISTRVQAKLLRVLQERHFERVGSSSSIWVDVRVIATSNVDLPRAVSSGQFRSDLFFRLNVLPIHLPPLRDRLEDVPALAEHFLKTLAAREGRPTPKLEPAAIAVMTSYSWPGNVRELQNICERALVLCRGDVIMAELIQPWLAAGQVVPAVPGAMGSGGGALMGNGTIGSVSELKLGSLSSSRIGGGESMAAPAALGGLQVEIADRHLEDIERDVIVKTLHKYRGHRQRTAQALGIGVRTLGLKLKKWKQLSLVDAGL